MKTIHSLSENLSEGMMLPKGSSDERGNPEAGYFRYNTDDKKIEVFDGTDWSNMDYAPSYVTSGLAMHFDAGNPNSYGGTGSTWSDLSQGGNDGSITGASYNSEGHFTFDGSNDYVSTSFSPSFSNSREYSLEMWVKLSSSYTSYNYHPLFGSDPTDGMLAGVRGAVGSPTDNGKLEFSETNTLSQAYGIRYDGQTYFDDAWHQIIYIAESTELNIHVDGNLVHDIVNSRPGGVLGGNHGLNLMSAFSGVGKTKGDLAIVRVYLDKALSTSEVTQNFNANKSRFGL